MTILQTDPRRPPHLLVCAHGQNKAFSYKTKLRFPSCPAVHQALRLIRRCTFSDTGLASCEYEAAPDNRLQRFFCVRSIAPPLWVELCVGIFGCTGSRIRHANPHGSAHPNWRSGGGIRTAIRELHHERTLRSNPLHPSQPFYPCSDPGITSLVQPDRPWSPDGPTTG